MIAALIRKKYLVVIALMMGLLGGIIYGIFFGQSAIKEYTVVVSKNGFIPATLSIKQGDAVTFVSDGSAEAFWPASDAHPTHGVYPEFDPKQPIPKAGSWTFVFDKTGLWKAHDHMNSVSQGEIVVYSRQGVTTDECLKRDDTLRFQASCWEKEFRNLLEKAGEPELFATIRSYAKTDELFKNNCHDVMHSVGNILYDNYAATGNLTFSTDMTSCGYGFFHGFVESIYSATGSYEQSRKFCDDLGLSDKFLSRVLARGAASACWHGVGHSIFDSQDSSAWGDAKGMIKRALDECEVVFTELDKRQGCASGVFNALDVAFIYNDYELKFDETDPFSHCSDIAEDYKSFCVFDVAVFYSTNKNLDREQALELFQRVDAKYFPEIIKAWVADNVQWRSANVEAAFAEAQQCFSFTESAVIDNCLQGVHLGIFKKNGPLENQAESNEICDLFEVAEEKEKCRQFIYIRDRDL